MSVLTIVSLIAAMLMLTASPAGAASEATYVSGGALATVHGTSPNTSQTQFRAGEMLLELEGGDTYVGYCIDIATSISAPESGLTEQDWNTVDQYETVQGILNTYSSTGTFSSAPGASRAERAAAIQAAIWHFTDGFELDDGPTDDDIVAVYDEILAAAGEPGFGQPPELPSLEVSPASDTGTVGYAVGPYTVVATGTVDLAATNGAEILDGPDGDPLSELTDGGEFWLRSTVAGSATITVTGDEVTVPSGRVFAKPGVQRLILAEQGTAKAEASATASWSDPANASVAKMVNGDNIPAGGFEFTLEGLGVDGGETATIDEDGTVAFDAPLVLGEQYTITETATEGWDSQALECRLGETVIGQGDGTAIEFTVPDGAAGETITCEFVNDQLHPVSVSKTVLTAPDASGYDSEGEFDIDWRCSLGEAEMTGTTTVTDGNDPVVLSDQIPHGYTCEITGESGFPALASGFAWDTPDLGDEVVVPEGDELMVTNEIIDLRGTIAVTKNLESIEGSGADGGTAFSIDVVCTLDDAEVASHLDQEITDGETWVSGPLAPGTECTVTEDDRPGLADGFAWAPVSVTVDGSAAATVGLGEAAVVTNTVVDERVGFEVIKVLENREGSGVDDTTTFPVEVACASGESTLRFSGEVSVDDPFAVGPVPVGYECVTTESDLPELAGGFVWGPVDVSPSPLVTTTEGQEAQVVTVTNRVDDPPATPVTGSVEVTKTLAGDDEIRDRDVVVTLECGTRSRTLIVTPGESGPETVGLDGLTLGSTCTITELASDAGLSDASQGTVTASIGGANDTDSGEGVSGEVLISSGETSVVVTNTYTDSGVGGEEVENTTTTTTEPETQVGGVDEDPADVGQLPRTGTSAMTLMVLALGASLLGLVLVAAGGSRRRFVGVTRR